MKSIIKINENTTNNALQLFKKENGNVIKFLQLYYMLSMPVRARGFSKKDCLNLMYVFCNIILNSKKRVFSDNQTFFGNYFDFDNIDLSGFGDVVTISNIEENLLKNNFEFDKVYVSGNKIDRYSGEFEDIDTIEVLYFLILKNYNYLNLLPLKSPNNYTEKNIEKWKSENNISNDVDSFELLHDHLIALKNDVETLNWIKNFPTDLKKSYYENETDNFNILRTYILKFISLNEIDRKRIKGIFFKKADENGAGIISAYKDFSAFIAALKSQFIIINGISSILEKIKENELEKQVDVVYNQDDIIVMDIHTKEASVALGTTAWCISRNTATNYETNYMKATDKPKLYFIYNFNLPISNKYYMIGTNIKNGVFNLTCDKDNKEVTDDDFKSYLREYNIPLELFRGFQKKDMQKQRIKIDPILEKYKDIKEDTRNINQVIFFLKDEESFKKVYKKHPDISKYMIYNLLSNVIDDYNYKYLDNDSYNKETALYLELKYIYNLIDNNPYFKIKSFNDTILSIPDISYRRVGNRNVTDYVKHIINLKIYDYMSFDVYKDVYKLLEDFEPTLCKTFKNNFNKKTKNQGEKNINLMLEYIKDKKYSNLYKITTDLLKKDINIDFKYVASDYVYKDLISIAFLMNNKVDELIELCNTKPEFKIKKYSDFETLQHIILYKFFSHFTEKNIEALEKFYLYLMSCISSYDININDFLEFFNSFSDKSTNYNLFRIVTDKLKEEYSEYEIVYHTENDKWFTSFISILVKFNDLEKVQYYLEKYKKYKLNTISNVFDEIFEDKRYNSMIEYLLSKNITFSSKLALKLLGQNEEIFDKYIYPNTEFLNDIVISSFHHDNSKYINNVADFIYKKGYKLNTDTFMDKYLKQSYSPLDMNNSDIKNINKNYKFLSCGLPVFNTTGSKNSSYDVLVIEKNEKEMVKTWLATRNNIITKSFKNDYKIIIDRIRDFEKYLVENDYDTFKQYDFLWDEYSENLLHFEDLVKDDILNKVYKIACGDVKEKNIKTLEYFLNKYKCGSAYVAANIIKYDEDYKKLNIDTNSFFGNFNIELTDENVITLVASEKINIMKYFLSNFQFSDELNKKMIKPNASWYYSDYYIGGEINKSDQLRFLFERGAKPNTDMEVDIFGHYIGYLHCFDDQKIEDVTYCVDKFIEYGCQYNEIEVLKDLIKKDFNQNIEVLNYLLSKNVIKKTTLSKHINSIYAFIIDCNFLKGMEYFFNTLNMTKLLSDEQKPIKTNYGYRNDNNTLDCETALKFNQHSNIKMIQYILELRKLNNIKSDYKTDLIQIAESSKSFIWYYNLSKNNSNFMVDIEYLLDYYKIEKNYDLTCFLIRHLTENEQHVIYNIWEKNKRRKTWSTKVRQLYKDYTKYKGTKNEHLLYISHPNLKNDNIETPKNERLITNFDLFLNKFYKV